MSEQLQAFSNYLPILDRGREHRLDGVRRNVRKEEVYSVPRPSEIRALETGRRKSALKSSRVEKKNIFRTVSSRVQDVSRRRSRYIITGAHVIR